MKKSLILVAALALAACGQQPQYPQQAQVQRPACDPQISDCYGFGVGRDSHGDALLAGVAGAGLGYAAGRMHANRINERERYDRDYDRDYDRRDRDYDRSYRRERPRTTVVKNYYNTPAPAPRSYSAPSQSYSAPAPVPRPATRTMFKSARRR